MRKILILGGYGNAGFLIAEYILLLHSEQEIIIAGRNFSKAELAVNTLKSKYPERIISPLMLDASDKNSLIKTFKSIDLVIVASSTLNNIQNIIESSIDTGADYFDINLSTKDKINFLKSKKLEIKERALCFITDGGFHPGIPAALIRYAALKYSGIVKANIFSVMKVDWRQITFSKETAYEMIDELKNYKPEIYLNGDWKIPKSDYYKKFNFGVPFGNTFCAAMTLEEFKILPVEIETLMETGFYISGFNWFVDWLFIPFAIYIGIPLLGQKGRGFLSSIFKWGLKNFSKPPYGLKLIADIEYRESGDLKSAQIELSHVDGYHFTAIPVVACLNQYLNDRKPGLWFQAEFVEPLKFINDIVEMGVQIKISR